MEETLNNISRKAP